MKCDVSKEEYLFGVYKKREKNLLEENERTDGAMRCDER